MNRVPLLLIAGLLVLRVVFLFTRAVNSDEAQHLHIIYGWLNGELPYLDRFDNHTPLFHWLFLPLAALAGERTDIVLLARLVQIPISFGVLVLFYWLGRRLCDRTIALWALAFILALADWSLKGLEFRPDVLWTALWFATLLVLTRTPSWYAFFIAGLLLGAALMTSIKTTVLLAALGLGWAVTWAFSSEFRSLYTPRRLIECAGSGALGLMVIPGAFLSWFAAHGALEAMRFCLFTVNQPDAPFLIRIGIFGVGSIIVLGFAWRLRREENGLRCAIFLAAAFYTLLIIGFSPSLKKQTFLPVYPLLILAAVDALQSLRWRWVVCAETAACICLTVHQITEGKPWRDGMAEHRALLRDTLALTRPGDKLLDLKGETIFRKRPVYFAYVLATRRGLESGRLVQEDPARLSSTGTAVVIGKGAGFTDTMRKFLKNHYVPAGEGRLRVAGNVITRKWETGHLVLRADLPVAGEYIVLVNGLTPAGTVRVTAPGIQDFNLKNPNKLLLYWKPAWDAGYRPLVLEIADLR